MKPLSAHWVATSAMEAAWSLALVVDSQLEDIEGAVEVGDLWTAMECAFAALSSIAAASCAIEDDPIALFEFDVLSVLAAVDHDSLRVYVEMQPLLSVTPADVEEFVATVRQEYERVRAMLPFELPMMRTPKGFFPTIRVAADLERLRSRLGLGPFDWTSLQA